ncbi:hypothetical protein EOM86_00745 [Candidatus Nomurabacteria bacterium]|nr:hypothetical protein [Candidatus Nomurabacteria bacterium]
MKIKVINLIRFLSVILIAVFLSLGMGGSVPADSVPEENSDETDFVIIDELDETLKASSGLQFIESNGQLELYADGSTTEIAVKVLSSGKMWYSNPQNRNDDQLAEPNNKRKLSSQIDIEYNNAADQVSGMNNFGDSIEIGQYYFAKIENGIRITYDIGKKKRIFNVPQVISASRFEDIILNKLDEDKKDYLLARFDFYSLEDETSEEIRKDLLEKMPKLEQENVYAIAGNLAEFVMEKIEAIFAETGYTYEDMIADNEYHGVPLPVPSTTFTVPVDYILDGDTLLASVRTAHIVYPENFRITELRFLNYFGSAGLNDEGYIVLPDGSGSVMFFNNGKENLPPYKARVYGSDLSDMDSDRLNKPLQVYLPVYGISRSGSGYLAVIESGAEISSVNAYVSGYLNSYNCVYPSFVLTTKTKLSVPYWRTNDLNIFQQSYFTKDLSVRFMFLDEGESDYTGMALRYQEYLLETGGIEKTVSSADLPFYLDLLGAIEYKDSILGIPATPIKALTTFPQAQQIFSELKVNGADNIVIRYLGWSNDGLNSTAMNRIKVQRQLGGSRALNSLLQTVNKDGGIVIADVDLQYVFKKTLFDRYSSLFDSPKTILGETAYTSFDNIATGARVNKINMVSPAKLAGYAEKTFGKLSALGIKGVSPAHLAEDVYSDYSKKNYIDRQDSATVSKEILKSYSSQGFVLLADDPNAYALSHLNHITGIPSSSNHYYCTDDDIPFYQIVLHGIVSFAGEPINMASDYETEFLKTIEYGSAPHFTWMYAENKELKKIDTHYYSVYYGEWLNQACEMYKDMNEALSEAVDKRITGHEKILPGVSKTVYENGTVIYVNYNDVPVSTDSETIGARDYFIKEGNRG